MRLENELRTEIEFWHDAIEEYPADASEESLERMLMARTLAERKLELLLDAGSVTLN